MDITDLLVDVATTLETLDLGTLTDGEVADLGQRLKAVTIASKRLKEHSDALKLALLETMPAEELNLAGTTIRKGTTSSTSWRHQVSSQEFRDAIAVAIGQRVSTDRVTGSVDKTAQEAAIRAVDMVWDVTGWPQGFVRRGGERLDIDVEDYRQTNWRPTIEVVLEGEPNE